MLRNLLSLFVVATVSTVGTAEEGPTGTLKGRIVDAATKRPVPEISVAVLETSRGTVTAMDGSYSLAAMPVGEYRLLVEGGGYQPLIQSDVVVRSARITYLNVEMHHIVVSESVTVSSPYFPEQRSQPVSQARLGAEEIRHAPGSANDISRALYALPGITQTEDIANDLAVRGGSPFENAFLIDNIPVLNINHFPQLGASGGNITMLNVDFVEAVDASTGGFGAENGNALSSVFDVRFRDGNKERSEGQLDVNMTGVGGTYEGPIGSHASWLLSAKRSFLDLLGDRVGSTTESTWSDVNAKVSWDLDQRHKLSFLSIDGDSRSDRSLEAARERGSSPGSEHFRQYVNGISWRALWGSRALSETSLSHNGQRVSERWTSAWGPEVWEDYTYSDDVWSLRNANQIDFGRSYSVKAGLEGSYRESSYRDRTGQFGSRSLAGSSTAAHVSQSWRPWNRLSTTIGVRGERFAFPAKTYWSPRVSASWLVSPRGSVSASFGRYRQQLPPYLIGQDKANENLDAPSVTHAIAGFRLNPSERTLISVEAYRKDYEHFPLSGARLWRSSSTTSTATTARSESTERSSMGGRPRRPASTSCSS